MTARTAFVEGIGTAPTTLLADGTVLPRHSLLDAEVARVIGLYDHVTRLPNRLQFIEDFPLLAGRGGRLLVMVNLADARHYSEILRALGHAFAEEFLRAGARQLGESIEYAFNTYHVSVLSFALVVENLLPGRAPPVVAEIVKAFDVPITCENIPIKSRVGIGLVPLDETMRDPTEALRAALAAAQDGRARTETWCFYDRRSDAAHRRAFRLLTDLPAALEAGDQLSLHFQPRIDMATNLCCGAEALLRWHHPQLGPVSPGEFIPLAEQTALIGPLTDFVLDSAVAVTRDFIRSGKALRVSVNVSPRNLLQPHFADQVLTRCVSGEIEPKSLEIEFTEGALITDFDGTVSQLTALRAQGVAIALDDFGAGYSSLSYLTRLPADVIKIDQGFVRRLGATRGDAYLLREIIDMAQGLGFRVCAEGIEDETTFTLLQSLGCDEGQGYLLGRPMAARDFDLWYRATY